MDCGKEQEVNNLRLFILACTPAQAFPPAMNTFVAPERQNMQQEKEKEFIKRIAPFPAEFAGAGRAGAFFQNAQQAHDKQRDIKKSE